MQKQRVSTAMGWAFGITVCLIAIFTMFNEGYININLNPSSAHTVSAAPNQLHGVYVIEGYNIHSYVEKNGQMLYSGIAHDYALMINPIINGEYVRHTMDDGHVVWFYRDTVVKVTEPVYAIKPGAKCYFEDDGRNTPKTDDADWWQKQVAMKYLIAPALYPNGGSRLVIDSNAWYCPDDQAKRFILRTDVELINPQDLN